MSLIKSKIPQEIKDEPRFKGLKTMYEGTVGKTKYVVFYSIIETYIHLRIIRNDSKPICNWMDMQEIKDLLIGKNKTAVQVFPKARDMVNNGNTYHLWVWADMDVPNLKDLYDYSQ